ncbi:MAG: KEOPS complex kinase/ATPase Bud32 [Candidatus Micrarchaeales archaeon]
MKMIGSGAEAKVYSANLFGIEMVVKERLPKNYRIGEIDEELRETRTKREAKILYELDSLGVNAPKLLGVGRFSIYVNRIEGRLLTDDKIGHVDFGKIGEQLGLMHNGNIAHGDFTPANVMKLGSEYFVIDFGLSEITSSAEEKAIDLLLMKRAINEKCYRDFGRGYAKVSKDSKRIFERLHKIEKRGRYQARSIA